MRRQSACIIGGQAQHFRAAQHFLRRVRVEAQAQQCLLEEQVFLRLARVEAQHDGVERFRIRLIRAAQFAQGPQAQAGRQPVTLGDGYKGALLGAGAAAFHQFVCREIAQRDQAAVRKKDELKGGEQAGVEGHGCEVGPAKRADQQHESAQPRGPASPAHHHHLVSQEC